jgi:hypothetical protein
VIQGFVGRAFQAHPMIRFVSSSFNNPCLSVSIGGSSLRLFLRYSWRYPGIRRFFYLPMVAPPSTAVFFVSRKRVFMYEPPAPWLLFIIYQLMPVRIQTHVFEMLEVIFFVADPMVHKPLLPTNELFCAAVEGGATVQK